MKNTGSQFGIHRARTVVAVFFVAMSFQGCASRGEVDIVSLEKPQPTPPIAVVANAPIETPGVEPGIVAARQALARAIEAYDRGDFNGAIKRLAAADIRAGDLPTRIKALKYSAFSYCVTNRQLQCRREFEKAMALDASFDLEAGEKGHPMWGPVFLRARKSARQPSPV